MTADALKRRTAKSIGRQMGFVLVTFVACVMGCGNNQQDSSSATPMTATKPAGVLRLSQEELSRTTIEIVPVERGRFRLSREFPATVQPNENELAEVTTLIRGRVVKVHVDVGQDVKKGAISWRCFTAPTWDWQKGLT